MTKKDSIVFMEYLDELFPNPLPELNFNNNFELLIAVVLSAQTTDIQVNKVTKPLFNKYPNPKDLMNAKYDDVSNLIKSMGLYKTKARNIIKLSEILTLKGSEEKELQACSLSNLLIFRHCVDTHVMRVSKGLGLQMNLIVL